MTILIKNIKTSEYPQEFCLATFYFDGIQEKVLGLGPQTLIEL